jgi:hypothetical protein
MWKDRTLSIDLPPVPDAIVELASRYEDEAIARARAGGDEIRALPEGTPMPKENYERSLPGEMAAGLLAEYIRQVYAAHPELHPTQVWVHCVTDVQMRAQGRLTDLGHTKQ